MKNKIIFKLNSENKEVLDSCKESLKPFINNKNDIEVVLTDKEESLEDGSIVCNINNPEEIKCHSFPFTDGIEESEVYILAGTDLAILKNGKIGRILIDNKYKETFHLFILNTNEHWVLVNNPYGTNFIFRAFGEKLTTSRTFCQRFPRSIRSDTLKCLYYIISKNCCSSVTNLLYKTDIDPNITEDWDPWDFFNGNIRKVHCSSIFITNESQLREDKLKNYRKFTILRDPIDRFLSLVNYTKDPNNPVGGPYMNKYKKITDKKQYVDLILIIMKGLMAVRDIWYHDDHFMAQKQHLSNINIDEIDDFVDIKDADDYFKEVYNLKLPKNNVTKTKFITKEDLTIEQLNEIKHLWAEDFELLQKVQKWERKQD